MSVNPLADTDSQLAMLIRLASGVPPPSPIAAPVAAESGQREPEEDQRPAPLDAVERIGAGWR
jgi:hypothetical protein